MSTSDLPQYVRDNSDMLSRILACGSDEARAYALALLMNSGDLEGVEDVERELQRVKVQLR
ncbi:hypothetical protein [Halorubellus sp. PRR65]|uniref:hypothetical protein n=1 Tax=Halorubellus sp. PRR65 TaxID=3098148 RepID=UPI002B260760|nr:hypothetical protein [Halorubellus sp. PRR65]